VQENLRLRFIIYLWSAKLLEIMLTSIVQLFLKHKTITTWVTFEHKIRVGVFFIRYFSIIFFKMTKVPDEIEMKEEVEDADEDMSESESSSDEDEEVDDDEDVKKEQKPTEDEKPRAFLPGKN